MTSLLVSEGEILSLVDVLDSTRSVLRSTRSSWRQKDGNKAPWKLKRTRKLQPWNLRSNQKLRPSLTSSNQRKWVIQPRTYIELSSQQIAMISVVKVWYFSGFRQRGKMIGCIHLLRYWWNRFYKMKCLQWKRLSPRAKRWQSQFSPMLRNCDKLYTSLYCIGWKLNREWNSNSCLLIYKALNDLAPPYISELITFNNIGSRGTSSPHVPLFMESPPGLFKLSPKSLE